jgi:hypothetical protein
MSWLKTKFVMMNKMGPDLEMKSKNKLGHSHKRKRKIRLRVKEDSPGRPTEVGDTSGTRNGAAGGGCTWAAPRGGFGAER